MTKLIPLQIIFINNKTIFTITLHLLIQKSCKCQFSIGGLEIINLAIWSRSRQIFIDSDFFYGVHLNYFHFICLLSDVQGFLVMHISSLINSYVFEAIFCFVFQTSGYWTEFMLKPLIYSLNIRYRKYFCTHAKENIDISPSLKYI